jgi:hypothetical protein
LKKHGFALVGTLTDKTLWNDSDEVGNIWSKCTEDEGTDCEDGDSDTDW